MTKFIDIQTLQYEGLLKQADNMSIKTDADAIKLRNRLLTIYPARELSVRVRGGNTFHYRVIGSERFANAIAPQLREIMKSSSHGKKLLIELSKLPKIFDIIEHPISKAAMFNGDNMIRHEQRQGYVRTHYELHHILNSNTRKIDSYDDALDRIEKEK